MENKAKILLEKYPIQFEKIRKVMALADQAYKNLPAEQRIVHSKRTRADFIADFFRSFAVRHLSDEKHIRILPHGYLKILIKDECLLTFKKLNNNLKPSYVPKWFYDDVSFNGSFKNMPKPAAKLVAGYRWEPVGQSFLHLVQPLGKGVQWSVELSEPETEESKKSSETTAHQQEENKIKVFPKGRLNKNTSV